MNAIVLNIRRSELRNLLELRDDVSIGNIHITREGRLQILLEGEHLPLLSPKGGTPDKFLEDGYVMSNVQRQKNVCEGEHQRLSQLNEYFEIGGHQDNLL